MKVLCRHRNHWRIFHTSFHLWPVLVVNTFMPRHRFAHLSLLCWCWTVELWVYPGE